MKEQLLAILNSGKTECVKISLIKQFFILNNQEELYNKMFPRFKYVKGDLVYANNVINTVKGYAWPKVKSEVETRWYFNASLNRLTNSVDEAEVGYSYIGMFTPTTVKAFAKEVGYELIEY